MGLRGRAVAGIRGRPRLDQRAPAWWTHAAPCIRPPGRLHAVRVRTSHPAIGRPLCDLSLGGRRRTLHDPSLRLSRSLISSQRVRSSSRSAWLIPFSACPHSRTGSGTNGPTWQLKDSALSALSEGVSSHSSSVSRTFRTPLLHSLPRTSLERYRFCFPIKWRQPSSRGSLRRIQFGRWCPHSHADGRRERSGAVPSASSRARGRGPYPREPRRRQISPA